MKADEQALLTAGRAAGYCWAKRSDGPGRCTHPPDHDGDHVDYYTGRRSPSDTTGHRWPR